MSLEGLEGLEIPELEELSDEDLQEQAELVKMDVERAVEAYDKAKIEEALEWAERIAAEIRRRFEVKKCEFDKKWN